VPENIENKSNSRRIAREKKTLAAMVHIFCHAHHKPATEICLNCQELLNYAICRLDRCPFGSNKPACSACPIHCYRPAMRAAVQQVMRFAGPRMVLRHPILALRHQLDGLLHRRSK
jgi:hypothetical protein